MIRPNKILEDGSNDWLHATGYHDSRDILRQSPMEVFVEVWIQLYILHQVVYAFGKGFRDGVDHFLERVAESLTAFEDITVALAAFFGAKPDIVCLGCRSMEQT
jgi:hypothetical protein